MTGGISFYRTGFLLCSLVCFLSLPLTAGAQTCPEEILTYWKLDESGSGTYIDAINATNTAGSCSAGCPTNTDGIDDVHGSAKRFDGTYDGIAVPANAFFDWAAGDSFSIELWVRRDGGAFSGTETLIARNDTSADFEWQLGINASGRVVFNLASGGDTTLITGSKDISDDSLGTRWHHVVAIRDAGSGFNRIYVDGVEETSAAATYSDDFISSTALLTIGFIDDAADYARFDGDLDEVALYDRVLTEAEIKSHYYLARGYCELFESSVGIMPMGDSITAGDYGLPTIPAPSQKIGYRLDLWELLGNNLYLVDLLGSGWRNEGSDYDFDNDHAGFPGIRDTELLYLLQTGMNQVPDPDERVTPGQYLNSYPDTEVILLHIGTNFPGTAGTVADLLAEIDDYSEHITVVLAKIIERDYDGFASVAAFNNAIQTVAENRISQGDKVIIVDMYSGAGMNYSIDTNGAPYTGDMYDGLHPNPSGYNKMAGKWFETLETFMLPAETPEFTSTAVTTLALGNDYTYTAKAIGPPDPTYSLVTSPSGMTVDAQSGLIEWAAPGEGTYSVTVRATNWAGVDEQNFTLEVSSLPVAQGDAYTGILEGGSVVIPSASGVLANDTVASGSLTAVLASDVTRGTLTLNSDGGFIYVHDGSEIFSDSFSYLASAGGLQSDPVTVSLTITAQNDAPTITGQGDLVATAGEPTQITLSNIVFSDPDTPDHANHSIVVRDGANYTISNGDTVTPNAAFSGELTVGIQVSDGLASSDIFNLQITVVANGGDGGGGGGGCFMGALGN